ncbi:hypothetical protein BBD42_30945 [Paenibacillus sp. BIHB 4019]|uniref:ArpU family transcriptional regulator n=1 Tax=Paenibacillus sp. BIHB 4019 TaxID=1870819 RepID=A0A1B2DRT6_9BACL|nr:hypothetical protein [Paenibacillus sp. BIHB 4019]ANY70422.1 hypothetical protein BBD42_30945 [Paenibacillus sp. BIHB 4019]
MMALELDKGEQLELFPSASKEDIQEAKKRLNQYHKCQAVIAEFERRGLETLSIQQSAVYDQLKNRALDLSSAINLIIDVEVKEIIKYRYVEGNKHAVTVDHFAEMMDDRTVERKLQKGIESVAESLKIMTVK